MQLTMATPGFKSVAATVGAALTVRLGRSVRADATVADFIGPAQQSRFGYKSGVFLTGQEAEYETNES